MSRLQFIALTCYFALTWGQLEFSMANPSSLEPRDNSTWNVSEYPDPRIVIVGPTGAGKSSLSNALLGCDPIGGTCAFPVCASLNSCTEETIIGTGQWLGDGENFTVVDTPGFGDLDGQDNKLIEEMIKVLNDDLGYTNIILLLLDGTMPRFTSGLQNMLRQMSSLFGKTFWDNVVIGVSKWEYSQAAIDKRKQLCDLLGHSSEHCKNEEWLMREITAQLNDKFHLDRNFTFTFIHSHSQTKLELTDPVQQEHYQAQAEILWEAATTGDSKFDFKTIDDVLEENELLKKKYRKLNFLFETNIATIYSLIHENKDRINGNGEKIISNEQEMKSSDEKTKEDLKNAVDRIVGTEGRILINEQDITISKRVIKSSVEKIKGDLKNAVDKTVEHDRGINGNVEKINMIKEDIKGAVNRINGNEKGIQSNVHNINTMKGDLKDTVDRIVGNEGRLLSNEKRFISNENGINSILEKTNTVKGELNEAVERIDGNEARILSNEKGINSNTENTNSMKGELKNALDRIDGNQAKILSNEKAIKTNGNGINSNMEKTNAIKGELNEAVNRISGNEKGINSHTYEINTMKGNLKDAVDRIDGNEARILRNEKGINSNTVNTNRMKGELKNAFDRIDRNDAKIHINEKAITNNGQGIKGNLEKANTMKGDLENAVGRIDVNERNIDSNEQRIEINEKGIQSNMEKTKGKLSSAVERIDKNEGKILTNEKGIKSNTQNTNKMKVEISNTVDNLKLAPIGTIIAWVNRPEKGKGEVVNIPAGWQHCDGSTIQSPSKWAGLLTPNINGEKRFLRGGSDRNVLTMEEQQLQNHEHTINDPGHSHRYQDYYTGGSAGKGPDGHDNIKERYNADTSRTSSTRYTSITVKGVKSSYGSQTVYRGTETRPKNMNVIYIMRIY